MGDVSPFPVSGNLTRLPLPVSIFSLFKNEQHVDLNMYNKNDAAPSLDKLVEAYCFARLKMLWMFHWSYSNNFAARVGGWNINW